MAVQILLKRSLNTAAPASLANGEFSYSANGDVAYIGSNGAVVPIGGKRTPGVLTANQALVANSSSYMDNIKTANLYIGSVSVNVINSVANSTVLGLAANNELTTTWAIKTYVDAVAGGASGVVPGSNTQVIFNDGGSSNATAGFVFNKTSNTLTVGNTTVYSTLAPSSANIGGVLAAGNTTITGFANVSSTLTVAGLTSVADLSVSGNLVVGGIMTTIDATSLVVKDSIIELADLNTTSDVIDIGLFGNFGNSTVIQYSGLYRDASDTRWKLFNSQDKPTTTVDTANSTYAQATLQAYLAAGGLTANSTAITITANSTYSVAMTANTLSLTTPLGITSGGSGLTAFTLNTLQVGNGTSAPTLISGTDGQVLVSVAGVPTWAALDGGTF